MTLCGVRIIRAFFCGLGTRRFAFISAAMSMLFGDLGGEGGFSVLFFGMFTRFELPCSKKSELASFCVGFYLRA